ncbi:hypothetical protein BaRGS_00015025 [Batillaria attramentaria]|uniref:Uncharacterized protein n=1 Tax=Batillaria attramentaria TaxID=370345 RepID=A0ABD0L351_9CAEN
MKVVIIFAALCAVALSQNAGALVRHEVEALLQADPTLTVEQCAAKCDELFKLVVEHDEATTDKQCQSDCEQ